MPGRTFEFASRFAVASHRLLTARPTSLVAMRRMLLTVLAALPLLGATCGPQTPPGDCDANGRTAYTDVRYTASPSTAPRLQSLDLYVPNRPNDCGPVPLVAYVHGGGFVTGDKANKIAAKVELFTNEGWAFASVNYRLVDDPGAGPTNGVYPAAEEDVGAALGYLASHANVYRIDANKVMLLGHSAGAFLVVARRDGSRPSCSEPGSSSPTSAVSRPSTRRTTSPSRSRGGGTEEAMFRNAFGDDPAVWAQASPPNQVAPDKDIPAFHIVTRGQPARVAQSEMFAAALRNAGVDAELQVVRGLTHEQVNEAVGDASDTVVTPPLMAFFRGCTTTAAAD